MKNTKQLGNRHSKSSSLSGNLLHIKIIEIKKSVALSTKPAKQFHYMSEGCPAGDTLRMVVMADGEWIALLLWGSACYRLKHRDEWIGWTDQQRAARQKLVVQNRRFVLLTQPGEHPNLASRILGMVVRELPALWNERFGYEPLLAETFSDIEAREGTCYKASGWTALGKTKGYSRHAADFYVPNDRPKKLWVHGGCTQHPEGYRPGHCGSRRRILHASQGQPKIHPSRSRAQREEAHPPFAQTEKAHGRIDGREIAVQSVTPMQVGFPHIQTVVKIWRTSTAYKTGGKEICYYLNSEPFDRRTPEQWLDLVCGHWGGVEIRILLGERTRS